MDKLFANGCSITLGAELGEYTGYFDEAKTEPYMAVDTEYRRNHRWSTLLANKLGYHPVNIAKGAGSNWRVWRTTLDFFNKPENKDFTGMAVIQLTGTERWQQPINETLIDEYHDHVPNDGCNFIDWIRGGIYAPDHDDIDPVIEEYLPWNQGNVRYIKEKTNRMHENFSDEMVESVIAQTKYISPIHNALDLMRLMESLIFFFRSKNVPLYFWDGMRNYTVFEQVQENLLNLESFKDVEDFMSFLNGGGNFAAIIELFYDYERFMSSSDRAKRAFYKFIKETKLYDKFRYKWDALKECKEVICEDFSDMYMSPRHKNFVGAKPGGHPDENCHRAISDKLYNYVAIRQNNAC